MRALVFGVPPEPRHVPDDANTLDQEPGHHQWPAGHGGSSPLHDDWVVTRPRLTGICGSDSKQILLDFGEGDTDNAMAAFCSFPQVMGHEVVADVVALGPKARGLEVGQRVVLNPWLSCGPRGIEPPARRARPATTACAGASPTATSSPASTPACRATPPAATPS